jgi:cell division protein ZapA
LKRSIQLEIDGQSFRMRSDASDEHLQAVSGLVSEKLKEVRETLGTGSGTQYKAALLVALNLADELFRERQAQQEYKERIEEQSRDLLGYLDELGVSVAASRDREARASQ